METLHRELHQRNVDLLITRKFGPLISDRMAFEFLFDDAAVVATGAQNPWARRRRITLADLAKEPWVLPPAETAMGVIARDAFRGSRLDHPGSAVLTDSPHVRMSLLATGRYFTILPAYALMFPASHPEIKVLPIELPTERVPNGMITLKNRTLGPATQLFLKEARAAAKSLA
jgi:DNA-binding transcriptional LysR family regulator